MKSLLSYLERFLKKIDYYRDELLFLFIKPYWPRKITPNHLTWARVLISVALFVLLFFLGIENKAVIIPLFIIGVLTDLFDGSVARGLNKITDFGAMLDSTADRLLIVPIAVYSLYQQNKWLLFFLILAEILSAIASLFYKTKDIYLESNIFGKTKFVFLCVAFFAILVVWPANPPMLFVDALWASLLFAFLSLFTQILEVHKKGYIKNKAITKQLNKYENF